MEGRFTNRPYTKKNGHGDYPDIEFALNPFLHYHYHYHYHFLSLPRYASRRSIFFSSESRITNHVSSIFLSKKKGRAGRPSLKD